MSGELTKFLEEREYAYRRLESLLSIAERSGLRIFNHDDLVEFGHLYRLAAADLARARYVLRSPLLAEYLNEIVGRAHHLIHRKRTSMWGSFIKFITRDFPVTVRKEIMPILLGVFLLFGAGLAGGISYQIDHEWGQLVWSTPQLRQYESDLQEGPAHLASEIDQEMMSAASAFIITNNIRACITATAGGILFGLGTLFTLVYNGFLLGVIGSMFLSRGAEYELYFWAGILPHGVLELPAICIAGGAGFLLARGLLIPGSLSRGDAIRREGTNAMKLLGGVILILVIAGLIEGFITPIAFGIGSVAKIIFAFVLLGGFIWYLARAGYRAGEEETDSADLRTTTHLRLD